MTTFRTPGVYIQEISTLPPSVAEVSTAIPAFIGYTEKRPEAGSGVQVARITTLLEYESLFGKAQPEQFKVTATQTDSSPYELAITRQDTSGTDISNPVPTFLMHYSLSMYFNNGGGPCYIISLDTYEEAQKIDSPAKKKAFDQGEAPDVGGLKQLEKLDEPTLILLTDAIGLDLADYHGLCKSALAQCKKLGDRFAVMDVITDLTASSIDTAKDAETFRGGIGTSDLKYGAAYYPYLQTSLTYRYNEADVDVTVTDAELSSEATGREGGGDSSEPVMGPVLPAGAAEAGSPPKLNSPDIKEQKTALYNQIKTLLGQQRVIMPPSGAIAGIYARVDRDRGVWKAPANVSVSSVIDPVVKITILQQDDLNVPADGAGKSINAIRAFTGKGTLVWGARTLAGDSNEWRYISVRRLFNMIEESTQKSTAFAVFEANDATTWLKVKGMIDSFLYGLWERGALAGPTPESAYFVNVGLGKTMTPQDVLEGRMIVEIGVAAVRPAEFIIIRFSHKLQEA